MAAIQRKAVVTGGGSGIGFGIAQALVEAGHHVILVGRSPDKLQAAAGQLGQAASWRQADVGCREDVRVALAGLERLDVLVNAAGFVRGVSLGTPAGDADANWDAVVETNLKGSYLMAHEAASLLSSPGGRIINIGSIAAQTGGSGPGTLAYAAAKSGLHGLTFALAREFAPRGITVNLIAPGFIAGTGFTGAWPNERVAGLVAQTPLGRAGTPSDVASAVAWLASDAASFVTGTVISINGGRHMG